MVRLVGGRSSAGDASDAAGLRRAAAERRCARGDGPSSLRMCAICSGVIGSGVSRRKRATQGHLFVVGGLGRFHLSEWSRTAQDRAGFADRGGVVRLSGRLRSRCGAVSSLGPRHERRPRRALVGPFVKPAAFVPVPTPPS